MKLFHLIGALALTCLLGCSKNIELLKDVKDFEPTQKIPKTVELCVEADTIPDPYIKRPTGYVGSALDFIFPLKNSLTAKTEYGMSKLFDKTYKCGDTNNSDIVMNIIFNNTDLSFACSHSGNFDEGGFESKITYILKDRQSGNKITKSRNVASHLTHTAIGGDILLTNQAIDKALIEYFDYFMESSDINSFFGSGNLSNNNVADGSSTN